MGLSWAVKYKIKVLEINRIFHYTVLFFFPALESPTQFLRTSRVLICGLSGQDKDGSQGLQMQSESQPLVLLSWIWPVYLLSQGYSMWACVFACSATKEKREKIVFFCNRTEPLQQFNSFGISERVRTETSSSPSAPVLVGVRVRVGLLRFSLVQLAFLRQGFHIPGSQNETVSVSVFLTLSSTASRSCPSLRSTPGSCRRTGSSRWSHDCCGRCRDGSEPGAFKKNTHLKHDNLMSVSRILSAGCVFYLYRTLNWEHGYENRCTFPKSSPVTRRPLSWLLQTALTSVPSEPSGHKPEERAEGQIQQRDRK